MGLFDFDINNTEPEKKTLYEVSFDEGKTWNLSLLTPTERLFALMNKCAVRRCFVTKIINLYLGNSVTPIKMIFDDIPIRDSEEYINDLLDGILNENLNYVWQFATEDY